MKLPVIFPLLLLAGACAWAQDDDEREFVQSCSLSVKTTVYPADSADAAGKAVVEVALCDKAGAPIPNQQIEVSASSGTFSCIPPDSFIRENASDRSCFITGQDGKIRVYLVSIPFNQTGLVKAACTYGDITVKASGSYSIMRHVIKKKRTRKSQGTQSTGR